MEPAAWVARCGDAKQAEWVAWNVCQDGWYNAETLIAIEAVIRAVDDATPDLHGPDLLAECALVLQRIRAMDGDERDLLPPMGVTHVMTLWFGKKYELAPESAYAEGSAPGELDPTLVAGQRIRVIPRGPAYFGWVTFDTGACCVGKVPDDVARALGLTWKPGLGSVVRVEVPIGTIRRAGALLAIPTFFDNPASSDWRARPEREHRPGEPWGHARDMRDDGPGLPEIIADITAASRMDAEILGPMTVDWSTRPYLAGGAPR